MSEALAPSVLAMKTGFHCLSRAWGVEHHTGSRMPGPHFRRGSGERRGEGKVKKIGSIFRIHSKNCFRFNLSHVDNTQNSPVSLSASRLLA